MYIDRYRCVYHIRGERVVTCARGRLRRPPPTCRRASAARCASPRGCRDRGHQCGARQTERMAGACDFKRRLGGCRGLPGSVTGERKLHGRRGNLTQLTRMPSWAKSTAAQRVMWSRAACEPWVTRFVQSRNTVGHRSMLHLARAVRHRPSKALHSIDRADIDNAPLGHCKVRNACLHEEEWPSSVCCKIQVEDFWCRRLCRSSVQHSSAVY